VGDDAKSEIVSGDGVLRALSVRDICGGVKDKCFKDAESESRDSAERLVSDADNLSAGCGRESCALIQKSSATKATQRGRKLTFLIALSTSSLNSPLILTSTAPMNSSPTAPLFSFRKSDDPSSRRFAAASCLASTSF
jgi:hypothetical protein